MKGLAKNNISMSWIGFQNVSEHYSNNRCTIKALNVYEFMNCYNGTTGSQNVNYLVSDKYGNIGFLPVVSYPIRRNPFASAYIQDGTKSANDWKGYVPFDDIPKVVNPEVGYIIN